MAGKTRTVAENNVETAEVEETTIETEKTQETANTEATKGRFIYIGPALGTGLTENAVFQGTRESVEAYLKPTIDKYPQARLLLVTTEKLAEAKEKVKTTGTILNKYYTDLVGLSKRK